MAILKVFFSQTLFQEVPQVFKINYIIDNSFNDFPAPLNAMENFCWNRKLWNIGIYPKNPLLLISMFSEIFNDIK